MALSLLQNRLKSAIFGFLAGLSCAFVRSGWVPLNDGLADVVGRSLYSWSRVATSASVTYYLGVLPTEVYPSNDSYRWAGLPLRCLYLGSV